MWRKGTRIISAILILVATVLFLLSLSPQVEDIDLTGAERLPSRGLINFEFIDYPIHHDVTVVATQESAGSNRFIIVEDEKYINQGDEVFTLSEGKYLPASEVDFLDATFDNQKIQWTSEEGQFCTRPFFHTSYITNPFIIFNPSGEDCVNVTNIIIPEFNLSPNNHYIYEESASFTVEAIEYVNRSFYKRNFIFKDNRYARSYIVPTPRSLVGNLYLNQKYKYFVTIKESNYKIDRYNSGFANHEVYRIGNRSIFTTTASSNQEKELIGNTLEMTFKLTEMTNSDIFVIHLVPSLPLYIFPIIIFLLPWITIFLKKVKTKRAIDLYYIITLSAINILGVTIYSLNDKLEMLGMYRTWLIVFLLIYPILVYILLKNNT